jgi:hypothetical protein
MYSLPNPSESETFFSTGRAGFAGTCQEGEGPERIAYAVRQGGHAIGQGGHRMQRPDIIGPGELAQGWLVRWGEGMGTGNEREGGGIFFTTDLC